MIKIELQNASNGIIKRVVDTQFNGVDQSAEIITLYELDESDPFIGYSKVASFLNDITKDLAIDTGSDFSPARLKFEVEWGDKYNPSMEEVNEYLKYLRDEMRAWKEYKRVIESNPNVGSV
jgi:hypothetical protein